MALASGAKLGHYEVLAALGAGGMGEVYRARDPQLGRDVAIKVLPASLSRDPDRLRRFEQEARADHNHLVYATGGNDARIFRMKSSDHKVQEIASLKNFRAVNDPSEGVQISVGPDNLPLVTRDLGTEQVYALSLKWP